MNHVSGSKRFYKDHGTELQDFVYRAQLNGYGNPDAQIIDNGDGSFSTPPFVDGDWRYVDTWYGGEPFSGTAVVWYKGVVCWTMGYWGRVMPIPKLDYGWVTGFLAEALQQIDPEHPWRGPTCYQGEDENLVYRKEYAGGIRRFSGQEAILRPRYVTQWPNKKVRSDEVLYEAFFRGGIVNKDLAVGGQPKDVKDSQPEGVANNQTEPLKIIS